MTDPDVAYVLAALPYAGMEALRIAGWCTAAVAPAALGCWLLARAHRLARRLGGLMDDGDGQGGIPGRGRLRRVVADADRKHLPVTIVMDLGGLVHPPHGGHITDRTRTEAIDPDPALGCPCCTVPAPPARRLNDDCWCAVPCGYPSCQALDPDGECEWCDLPALLAPAPCACPGNCGAPWCASGAARHGR